MDNNPYASPTTDLDGPTNEGRPDSRGGCLTTFLLFALVMNSGVAIAYIVAILNGSLFGSALPPVGIVAFLAFGALLNVASSIAIWKWYRWGVYAFFAMALAALCVNLYLGVEAKSIVFGVLGPVILAALVRPIWRHLR
ncbi:MAG: hypothetical protein V4857_00455 [Pseudomonadota bacterium]